MRRCSSAASSRAPPRDPNIAAPAAALRPRGGARRAAARCAARICRPCSASSIWPISRVKRCCRCWSWRGAWRRGPSRTRSPARVLGLLFMNPSLRTLASFQSGMARLGGSSFVITPARAPGSSRRVSGAVMDGAAAEHIHEGIPVLASYCDALGIRSFADGKDLAADVAEQQFTAMAALTDKPLINLESAINHPCQSLADWKTLDELAVPRNGKLRAQLGLSSARAAAGGAGRDAAHGGDARHGSRGAAARRALRCRTPLMDSARGAPPRRGRLGARDQRARRGAGRTRRSSTSRNGRARPPTAMPRSDARLRRRSRTGAARRLVRSARSDCRLMHCLPVRRNVAIADEVLDGPRSVVLRQAYNRLPAQMAVLYRCSGLTSPRKRTR